MFRRETIVFNYKEILEANPDLPYICATNRALIYTSGVFNVRYHCFKFWVNANYNGPILCQSPYHSVIYYYF